MMETIAKRSESKVGSVWTEADHLWLLAQIAKLEQLAADMTILAELKHMQAMAQRDKPYGK